MDFIWSNLFRRKQDGDQISLELLRNIPLFSDLKDSQLREFLLIAHIRTYSAGEVIFWEGEPGVGMYIIKEGRIQISKRCDDDAQGETVLAELKDGDFFGELALLDDSPRSACAIAKRDTILIGIFRPDLFDLFQRKPTLGVQILLNLARIIGQRLKATNQELKKLQDQTTRSQKS